MLDLDREIERELSTLNQEVGNARTEEYQDRFAEMLYEIGLFELNNDGLLPLEVWTGIAQAVADASGLRVTLQSHVLEAASADGKSGRRSIGYREVAVGDPNLFVSE